MNPLVSVIIPSYNHENFLNDRIHSILSQTYQNFELIIMDDLSPDNSRNIIEKFRHHPKVSHIIYNEKNSGSTFYQWNDGILKYAKGEYVWIAESDDMCDQSFLENLMKELTTYPNLVLAYSQSVRLNNNNEKTGSWITWTESMKEGKVFNQSFQMNGTEFVKKFMLYRNVLPNASGVVFKKDAFVLSNGAIPLLKTNGDWDIWIKILLQGDIYYCREELNYFRFHDNSVIAKSIKGNILKRKYKEFQEQILLKESVQNAVKDLAELSKINKKLLLKSKLICKSLAIVNSILGARKNG